ncbi:acyl-CoA synthetase, partial [Streptomyces sp. NPDC002067]
MFEGFGGRLKEVGIPRNNRLTGRLSRGNAGGAETATGRGAGPGGGHVPLGYYNDPVKSAET